MEKFRYRVRHCKLAPFHLLAHLDVYRMWERAFRRAAIPVLYSQGFNPRPLFSFPFATPLGVESTTECFEVLCGEPLPPWELQERLNREVPEELAVTQVQALASFDPPLQKILRGIVYVFFFPASWSPKEEWALPEDITVCPLVGSSPVVSFLFKGEKVLWNPLKLAAFLETNSGCPFPRRIVRERLLLWERNGG